MPPDPPPDPVLPEQPGRRMLDLVLSYPTSTVANIGGSARTIPLRLIAVYSVGWTWYYCGPLFLTRIQGRWGAPHYTPVTDRVYPLVCKSGSKTPWLDVCLLWMAASRLDFGPDKRVHHAHLEGQPYVGSTT